MADDPDNITLRHLREIRADFSSLKVNMRELSGRMLELETRELANGSTRVRHEERLSELEAALDRVTARLGLRDGD